MAGCPQYRCIWSNTGIPWSYQSYVSSHHPPWPQNMQLCRFSHEFVPFQALLEGVLSTLQLHTTLGRPSIVNKSSGCLVYIMIMTSPAFGWMNISPSCPFRGQTKGWGLFVVFSEGSSTMRVRIPPELESSNPI